MTRRRTDRSDLQPAVGSREEEVGRVVGVRQLQHSLFETGLVSAEGEQTLQLLRHCETPN